jgi:hypothetical protein
MTKSMLHIPHGPNNTSEATEEHGRRKMHRLVRRILISLCSLAGTEECQKRMGKVQLDDVLHREPTVVQ